MSKVIRQETELQKKYRVCRRNGSYCAGEKEWDAAVKEYAKKRFGDNPAPEQWVEAAEKTTTKCDQCQNGVYYWGASVNGVMSNSGPCARCQGKGRQSQADYVRNWGYDQHRQVV